MKDVRESYTAFHETHKPVHVYPTEWVVRTLLGKYPRLSLDKSKYMGGSILDVGFGDGRNWPLLHNIGLAVSGVEISEKIISLGHDRARALAIPVTLKVGSNSALPFPDESFDYILACHSAYYIDAGTTFAENVREYHRVLKPGGSLLASLPEANGSIFDGCVDLGDGCAELRNDAWGLRDGYVFRRFHSEDEVRGAFESFFDSFSVGLCRDDYFGFRVNVFLLACRRKTSPDPAVEPLDAAGGLAWLTISTASGWCLSMSPR
jgi:SAM-dependent methyltransferase